MKVYTITVEIMHTDTALLSKVIEKFTILLSGYYCDLFSIISVSIKPLEE